MSMSLVTASTGLRSHVVGQILVEVQQQGARPMSYTWLSLDATPMSVREARQATRMFLQQVDRRMAEPAAALIVSELVTNSVVHARGPIVLHLWDEPDRVRVGVSDGSTAVACNEPSGPGVTSGRGMHLVERFSSHWGSDVHDTGKLTWADIPAV